MRVGEQTNRHLLLAAITTVFSGMLSLITIIMAWELWVVPLMVIAGAAVPYFDSSYYFL